MALWFAIGLPAYALACVGVGKFIAFGMGSEATRGEKQIVHDVFARKAAYEHAQRQHHGQTEAWLKLRDAKCAQLRSEVSR